MRHELETDKNGHIIVPPSDRIRICFMCDAEIASDGSCECNQEVWEARGWPNED